MEFDFELYKVFYYVASAKNLTKASELMHISQPAITKHIKNLESQLKMSLFIRTKRGVILTESGIQIFEQVKNMIICAKNIDNIATTFSDIQTGTIKIGAGKSMIRNFIIPALTRYKKERIDISIDLTIRPTSELLDKLKKGEIDFVFSKFPKSKDSTLEYKKLGVLHDILITNKDYPELLNRKVRLDELQKYPLILPQSISESEKRLEGVLKQNNLKFNANIRVGSLSIITKLVHDGHGIGLVTKEYAKDSINDNDIFEIDIVPKLSIIEYGIIVMPSLILSTASKKFIEYLQIKE